MAAPRYLRTLVRTPHPNETRPGQAVENLFRPARPLDPPHRSQPAYPQDGHAAVPRQKRVPGCEERHETHTPREDAQLQSRRSWDLHPSLTSFYGTFYVFGQCRVLSFSCLQAERTPRSSSAQRPYPLVSASAVQSRGDQIRDVDVLRAESSKWPESEVSAHPRGPARRHCSNRVGLQQALLVVVGEQQFRALDQAMQVVRSSGRPAGMGRRRTGNCAGGPLPNAGPSPPAPNHQPNVQPPPHRRTVRRHPGPHRTAASTHVNDGPRLALGPAREGTTRILNPRAPARSSEAHRSDVTAELGQAHRERVDHFVGPRRDLRLAVVAQAAHREHIDRELRAPSQRAQLVDLVAERRATPG